MRKWDFERNLRSKAFVNTMRIIDKITCSKIIIFVKNQKMKIASLKEIKTELSHYSNHELMELCLLLAKSRKENKEHLTYLLFGSEDEEAYIQSLKSKMDVEFIFINTDSFYYVKKSLRKILRELKKFIRYSKNKETEVVLLIYFCHQMKNLEPSLFQRPVLSNLFNRQLTYIEKKVGALHEDLQYDYNLELQTLKGDQEE